MTRRKITLRTLRTGFHWGYNLTYRDYTSNFNWWYSLRTRWYVLRIRDGTPNQSYDRLGWDFSAISPTNFRQGSRFLGLATINRMSLPLKKTPQGQPKIELFKRETPFFVVMFLPKPPKSFEGHFWSPGIPNTAAHRPQYNLPQTQTRIFDSKFKPFL